MNKGLLYAILAYLLWGFLPVYWKALQTVPAGQIVGHRMVWSLVFVGGLFFLQNRWSHFINTIKNKKVLLIYLSAAAILTVNWFIYIWGVNAGYVVETALGYFINPLVNVLLGVVLLRERLRPGQWAAVGAAAVGVLFLTIVYGTLPWIALALAFSFAIYALIKKTAPLAALDGLFLETALLFLPALLFLFYQEYENDGKLESPRSQRSSTTDPRCAGFPQAGNIISGYHPPLAITRGPVPGGGVYHPALPRQARGRRRGG